MNLNRFLAPWVAILCVGGTSAAFGEQPEKDQISQVSVINALMLGQFHGTAPLKDVLKWGDFGLGTFDHLDGEMIILDGKVYQARADGSIHKCDLEMTTPFAVITPFEGEEKFDCPAVASLEQFELLLKDRLPPLDMFVAIKVRAKFDSISLRAVARQEPPFLPLAEVVKTQSQWQRTQISGTMIGIRSPKWVTGIGIPGYHWHFLSDDHQSGGHVFDCQFQTATVEFDRCGSWMIRLGEELSASGLNLNQDLSKEIDQVERQRQKPTSPDKKAE